MCGTCHVYVNRSAEKIPRPAAAELQMLDLLAEVYHNSRLSCQIMVTADLDEAEFK